MTGSQAPLLAVRDLHVGYGSGEVLHGLDLTVKAGEVVALLGPNGAGKTTTLCAISGLLRPSSGTIEVFGRAVRRSGVWRLARTGLAHVPEDRGLFSELTVAENLRLGRRRSSGDAAERALGWFPALEPLADRRAGLLSGGEQQMLVLARALAGRPRLLMVDELSLGLAPIVVARILPVLRDVADDTGVGVLLVEQHVSLALSVSDHAVLLSNGRVAHHGTAAELAAEAELIESGYLGGPSDSPTG